MLSPRPYHSFGRRHSTNVRINVAPKSAGLDNLATVRSLWRTYGPVILICRLELSSIRFIDAERSVDPIVNGDNGVRRALVRPRETKLAVLAIDPLLKLIPTFARMVQSYPL